jgi:pyruvate kinase
MSKRNTKIVATIGPASQDEATIFRLVEAGIDIARLNFSHGNYADYVQVIARIRKAAKVYTRPVCILQDLQGPKIRTGSFPEGEIRLLPGQEVRLVAVFSELPKDAGPVAIPVDFPELAQTVSPGGRILLDDGRLELMVLSTGGGEVVARVIVGGGLKSHKGINLPGAVIPLSSVTEKDERDLAFGLEQGIDAIALSFVRSAQDIEQLLGVIARLAPQRTGIPVIAKLEKPEAVDNLEEILEAASGVMVARGDLGVEMAPEMVPVVQKRIIEAANRHNKIVITATQMLESMIDQPRPTRAEASDVANAILDGSDGVMLSGETAVGNYPVEAVQMMEAIICQAEVHISEYGRWQGPQTIEHSQDDAFYVTLAARELAHDTNVSAIAVFTKSGRTALLMSKVRPSVPIFAFTPVPETYMRMAMYWGVRAFLTPHVPTIETMIKEVESLLLKNGYVQENQQVVLVCGFPVHQERATNLAMLYTIGGLRV